MVAVLNVEPMNHFLDQLCIWHNSMLLLLSKGYYRNTACTLNYISTLLLIKQISWFYWWRRHAVNFLVSCLYLPWFCSTWLTCVVDMLATSSFLVKNSTSRTIICKFSAIVAPCKDSTLRGGVISVISTLTFDQTCWIHTILRLFARSLCDKPFPLAHLIPDMFVCIFSMTVDMSTVWVPFTAWMVILTTYTIIITCYKVVIMTWNIFVL